MQGGLNAGLDAPEKGMIHFYTRRKSFVLLFAGSSGVRTLWGVPKLSHGNSAPGERYSCSGTWNLLGSAPREPRQEGVTRAAMLLQCVVYAAPMTA